MDCPTEPFKLEPAFEGGSMQRLGSGRADVDAAPLADEAGSGGSGGASDSLRANHCFKHDEDYRGGRCIACEEERFDAPLERAETPLPPVLDACCGSRMFWFDKADPRALFVDKRREEHEIAPDAAYPNGSKIVIAPDLQADFTALPFPDESFSLVVFDPPHFIRNTDAGINRKKYGHLTGDWREMLRRGFAECFRVLKPHGTLIFKWAESSVKVSEILKLTPQAPLFGHQTRQHSKTHWCAFLKGGGGAEQAGDGNRGTNERPRSTTDQAERQEERRR